MGNSLNTESFDMLAYKGTLVGTMDGMLPVGPRRQSTAMKAAEWGGEWTHHQIRDRCGSTSPENEKVTGR